MQKGKLTLANSASSIVPCAKTTTSFSSFCTCPGRSTRPFICSRTSPGVGLHTMQSASNCIFTPEDSEPIVAKITSKPSARVFAVTSAHARVVRPRLRSAERKRPFSSSVFAKTWPPPLL